jgi:predicted carbohydrate-binding protein with CBM5 and CBM33 domain
VSALVRLRPRSVALRGFAVAAAAVLLLTTALANSASAHGNVIDPASRNYSCWDRWADDFQNPAMATEDPMCWQAWQANPNAMWNWNGLFREGVAGNHQGAIPDGQLCSAGHTEGGRYNALDTVGTWHATNIANNFRIRLYDQASHGADYIRVYVTRQGFNSTTQALRWSDLELIGQIGNTPASQWTPDPAGGVSIQVGANAAGRTGRHMVYTIWQASHLDQSYYFCSDVIFGGGTPTTAPTTTPPTQNPTTAPPTSPPTSTPPTGSRSCSATYTVTGQWTGGFQGEVRVTAGSAAISGWTVTWTYANGQTIAQSWNASVTSSGSSVTARNVSYNGSLGAGGSTTFGFLGSWNGTNGTPTPTCTAS